MRYVSVHSHGHKQCLSITNSTRSGSFFDGFESLGAPLAFFMTDHVKTFEARAVDAQLKTPPPKKTRRTGPTPQSATPAPRVVGMRLLARGSSGRTSPAVVASKLTAGAEPTEADLLKLAAGAEPSEADLLKLVAGAAALPPKKNAQRDIMRWHQIARGLASDKVTRKFASIGKTLGIVKAVEVQ